jgi:3-oxoadipate enol-lactonase
LDINSAVDFIRMARGALASSGFARKEAGQSVYWESAARDRTLVLIHGASDHAGSWFPVAAALAASYHVVIPDLAGHGESEPATGPIPISRIVDQLDEVITAAVGSGGDLTLAGNSLGGWISLLYTLRAPKRVSRLFLEDSGGLDRPLSSPLVARDRAEALTILRAVHGPASQAPEWDIDALLQRAVDSPMLRLTEIAEHSVERRLGEITIPATLIWGADDGVIPLDYARALQEALPNATLCVIEGAAHIPHMQQPQRFLQCLTSNA